MGGAFSPCPSISFCMSDSRRITFIGEYMLTEKITEEIIKAAFMAEKPMVVASRNEFSKEYLEPIDVIDEDDNIIGLEDRGICHSLGLRHKVIFVFLVSPDGKILLQKKRGGINPETDILNVAVEGHVGASEDIGPCAVRKIKEKCDFNPQGGRLKLIASYNRNSPFSLSNPRVINNEQRSLFQYLITTAEMAKLSEAFQMQDKKETVRTIEWCSKEDIVEAINMNRTTDELLTCFIHYLVYKLPDSEIKIG
jgi:isopentenyldiphosphate isomerase